MGVAPAVVMAVVAGLGAVALGLIGAAAIDTNQTPCVAPVKSAIRTQKQTSCLNDD